MPLPTDAVLLAALETQYRRLDEIASRLELARATLLPQDATFWLGSARLAYDSAMSALATTVDAGIAALRSARDLTGTAITEVRVRG